MRVAASHCTFIAQSAMVLVLAVFHHVRICPRSELTNTALNMATILKAELVVTSPYNPTGRKLEAGSLEGLILST